MPPVGLEGFPVRADVLGKIEDALSRSDFHAAMDLSKALLDLDATDAEALAVHAWASVNGGDAPESELVAALAQLERAVSLDRRSDRAVYHRGLAYKRLGNVPSAFRDFARAMQLNPNHAGAEREVRLFAMRVRKVPADDAKK